MRQSGAGWIAGLALVVTGGMVTLVALAGAEESPEETAKETSAEPEGDTGSRSDTGVADEGDGTAETHETEKAQDDTAPTVTAAERKAGKRAFAKVAKVLQSPRCMNCHPNGDRPLQTDESRPHRMNISRKSLENGMECSTCHREKNSEAYGIEGGPPGAPHWGLPPKETPMIFEGRTNAELCRQLKDPERNGGKSMDDLMHHVAEDPLVLWGWSPGGDRTTPPLTHEEFVAAFETWVESGGACP